MTQNAVETPFQVPEHEPYLQVTWRDSQTPARGYVVIDQLVTGIATGGLRMRKGCTAEEVAELAREMTLKMGAFGIHVGGAKGGIDFDPNDPRAEEVRERFLLGVRPLLERFWVTAGDLGTQQERLDQTFRKLGIGENSFNAALVRAPAPDEVLDRVTRAATTRTDGLDQAELVGGYGVAEAALAALDHQKMPYESVRAIVQGFGAMGGSTALYLERAGVKVVGITDAQGLIRNTSRGLDVELLLSARSKGGLIDRSVLREDDEELPGDAWLSQDVDLLVPAAVSYTITEENCDQIRGSLIVEAANVPTTPEAERRLLERGVRVIPDFIANTGAAAGAWWVILGEVVSPTGACSRLSQQIRPLVGDLMARAESTGTSVRTAGIQFARENSQRMIRENGGAVAFRELYPEDPGAAYSADGAPAPVASAVAEAAEPSTGPVAVPEVVLDAADVADKPLAGAYSGSGADGPLASTTDATGPSAAFGAGESDHTAPPQA